MFISIIILPIYSFLYQPIYLLFSWPKSTYVKLTKATPLIHRFHQHRPDLTFLLIVRFQVNSVDLLTVIKALQFWMSWVQNNFTIIMRPNLLITRLDSIYLNRLKANLPDFDDNA